MFNDELTSTQEENNSNENKKINLIRFLIVLTQFIILTALCITEGFLKVDEYAEYARTVENANITTVLGQMMFTGPVYAFIGAIVIYIASKFIKKINPQIKKTLQFLPIGVMLLTLPALLLSSYIVEIFNLV